MPPIARPAPTFSAPTLWLAVGLCAVLAAGRSLSGWAALSSLQLPDTDDVMRLVQIRDWLGGQGFFDLTQYRLGGADGTPMHWSRLGDLGPAAIMLAARPILGAAGAELAALILWPSLLFLAFMLLSGSIARVLGGDRATGVAIVLAALAFPAAAMFVPGRIDHHGLQLVLLLVAVRHLVGTATRSAGVTVGVAIAASLAIGVELVASLAILCGYACARWIFDGARERLSGLAIGLFAGLAVMAILAPTNWIYPACDAFTRQAALAAMCAAAAMAVLAHLPLGLERRGRAVAACLTGMVTLGAIALLAPACVADPYAAVDPLVRSGWMAHVQEARGLMALTPGEWIGMAGLALVALVAAIARTAQLRDGDWGLVTAIICGSVALAMLQARAIHVAAALAPAVLAPLVAEIRAGRQGWAPLAWLVSIGISYPLAGKAIATTEAPVAQRCNPQPAVVTLGAIPPATILAPIDLGPQLLLQTDHHVLAAPYHRNGEGIRAWLNPQGPNGETIDYLMSCASPLDRGAE
jgi:hypothetical protein